jgi:hypothetical protein
LHVQANRRLLTCDARSCLLLAAMGWTNTCLMPKSLACHKPKEIPGSTATTLMVSVWSTLTTTITPSLLLDEGHPEHASLSTDVHLPLKWWNQSAMCVQLMTSSQKAVLIISYVTVPVFSSFAHNLIHVRCSLLSNIMHMTHNTNTTVYSWWLHQTEWLQWGLTDWGYVGICTGVIRKVLSQCDVKILQKWSHLDTVIRPHISNVLLVEIISTAQHCDRRSLSSTFFKIHTFPLNQ